MAPLPPLPPSSPSRHHTDADILDCDETDECVTFHDCCGDASSSLFRSDDGCEGDERSALTRGIVPSLSDGNGNEKDSCDGNENGTSNGTVSKPKFTRNGNDAKTNNIVSKRAHGRSTDEDEVRRRLDQAWSRAGGKGPRVSIAAEDLRARGDDGAVAEAAAGNVGGGHRPSKPSATPGSGIVALSRTRKRPTPPGKQLSVINRYRAFLRRYEPSLDLVENLMERFFFRGYMFKNYDETSSNVGTEFYYAAWNVFRWINDVVLVGWGEGTGSTVGKREELLTGDGKGRSVAEATVNPFGGIERLVTAYAVPFLRAILTATTCLYPAVEAYARHRGDDGNGGGGRPKRNATSRTRREARESSKRGAIVASHRLESIRFAARMALLAASWWARNRRQRRRQQEEDPTVERRESTTSPPPAIPALLRRGGELDPYESLVSLEKAEEEADGARYVGRRTGRRAARRTTASSSTQKIEKNVANGKLHSPFDAASSPNAKLRSFLSSTSNKAFLCLAMGEFLHVLRPWYWTRAERSSSSHVRRGGASLGARSAMRLWKAWIISLLMDVVSDGLLRIGDDTGDDTIDGANAGARGRYRSRRWLASLLSLPWKGVNGYNNNNNSSTGGRSSSAEEAKRSELEWRKHRWSLYLLRSPMYDAITLPVANSLASIVSSLPLPLLGSWIRWAAEYALDLMHYWNGHHFMLEAY